MTTPAQNRRRWMYLLLFLLFLLLFFTIVGYAVGFIVITPRLISIETQLGAANVTDGVYGSLTEVPVLDIGSNGLVFNASTVPATSAATASTYATRDSNAGSAFGSLTLGGTLQQSLQFLADTTPAAGIAFGTDTFPSVNLYRASAGIIRTDAAFIASTTVNTLFAPQSLGTSVRYALNVLPLWNMSTASASNVGAMTLQNVMTNSLAGTNAIATVDVVDGGSGYLIGDLVVVSGGNTNSQLRVTSIGVTGAITALLITRGGSGYTAGSGIALTGGAGMNATVNTTVATVAFSFVIGLNVQPVYATGSFSTSAITSVVGLRLQGYGLGSGPLTVTNNFAIQVDNIISACASAALISAAAIGGGTTSNTGISIASVGGGTGTNVGVSIGSVTGAAVSNTGFSIGSVSGASTTNTGVNVGAVSGGTTNIGVKIALASGGTTNYALWLTDATGVTGGGITWGSDAQPTPNLYRAAANTLRTQGIFQGNAFRIAATSTTAITGSVQWNQTTGTLASGVGVLGTNSLTGLQLSTNGISTFVVSAGGTGYAVNNLLTVTGGSGTAQVKVTSVSSGAILTVVLTRPGSGYSVANDVALTGGSGTATLNITAINTTPFTTVVGVQGQGFDATSGFVTPTVTTAIGFQTVAPVLGSGPVVVTNIVGIDVPAHAITTTNAYGLRIAAPTGGATINAALNFVSNTIAAGGITFGADATPSTNLYRSATNIIKSDADVGARHIYGFSASIPTAVAGTGAGTGPTITVTAGSTDCKMQVTVLTGTVPTAAGIIITVTYNSAFINTLNKGVIFSAAGANAALLSGVTQPYISAEALGTFVLTAGPTGLTAATSYVWNFQTCT